MLRRSACLQSASPGENNIPTRRKLATHQLGYTPLHPWFLSKTERLLPTSDKMYHSNHGEDFPNLCFQIHGGPAKLGPTE
ncbi:hypothetical protein CRENBAI_016184 [Crenichthys baileyi]|uniref:Uncharacterized protein n=1 Tax=Crenichthys baileyi TaxID=28760 RepID=A0AAV9SPU1_9TELE